MATPVIMPTFGSKEGEAKITIWFKEVGDTVEADESLFEAETDKATVEVPASESGVLLQVITPAGETVPLKAVVAWIGQPDEDIPTLEEVVESPLYATNEPETPGRSAIAPLPSTELRIKASPIAKRLAHDHNIDLGTVQGTGPGGRIVKADVERILDAKKQTATEASIATQFEGELLPLTALRRVTVRRLTLSARTTVPVPLFVDVDMTEAKRLREMTREEYERRFGTVCSYNALMIRSCTLALCEHPALNVQWTEEGVRLMHDINIGLAVAVNDGLLVPVVKNADKKSLGDIQMEISKLIDIARNNRLSPEQMTGGTFTITNLGTVGIDAFVPVINPPESSILAIGRIADRVIAVEGQPAVRPITSLCLVFDHRAVDGAPAAACLGQIKALLENPYLLI